MQKQNFEKTLREVTMDGALTSCLMKWERRGSVILDSSTNRSLRENSNRSLKDRSNLDRSTPGDSALVAVGAKPASATVPTRRLAANSSCTSGNTSGRIDCSESDRFIGSRHNVDNEWGYGRLYVDNQLQSAGTSAAASDDPSFLTSEEMKQKNYERALGDAVNAPPENFKIVGCRDPKPNVNPQKVLFEVVSAAASTTSKKIAPSRHIPNSPERILDAPSIMDDFYLNLIHWSANNHLATALASWVYLWQCESGEITELMGCQNETEYVSCVQWIETGPILAIGTSFGVIQLWDINTKQCVRTMNTEEQETRVGALAWNNHILSSGNSSGNLRHHDVRVANHEVGRIESAHEQEICGLSWSPNRSQLASGGNDNTVKIWSSLQDQEPVYSLSHQAAVKSIAWCPWKANLLATGGGSTDRTIRLWNTLHGREAREPIDTGSQVSGLVWNSEYKELCSSHGYAEHQISLWKYPQMHKIVDLKGHSQRIISLTGSSDGQFVASAGADETLRIWKCFASSALSNQKKERKNQGKGKNTTANSLGNNLPLVNSNTFPRGGGIR